MPILRGWKAQIKSVVWIAMVGIGVLLAILTLGCVALPHVVFLWWFWALVLFIACMLGLMLICAGYTKPLRALFTLWYHVDPLVAFVVLIALLSGTRIPFVTIIRKASLHCCTSYALTLEFLAPYSQRIPEERWKQFKKKHNLACIGFGILISFTFQMMPLTSLCLLGVFGAASANLLVALLQKDAKKTREDSKPKRERSDGSSGPENVACAGQPSGTDASA
jgi:hypothetical protein